ADAVAEKVIREYHREADRSRLRRVVGDAPSKRDRITAQLIAQDLVSVVEEDRLHLESVQVVRQPLLNGPGWKNELSGRVSGRRPRLIPVAVDGPQVAIAVAAADPGMHSGRQAILELLQPRPVAQGAVSSGGSRLCLRQSAPPSE